MRKKKSDEPRILRFSENKNQLLKEVSKVLPRLSREALIYLIGYGEGMTKQITELP